MPPRLPAEMVRGRGLVQAGLFRTLGLPTNPFFAISLPLLFGITKIWPKYSMTKHDLHDAEIS